MIEYVIHSAINEILFQVIWQIEFLLRESALMLYYDLGLRWFGVVFLPRNISKVDSSIINDTTISFVKVYF